MGMAMLKERNTRMKEKPNILIIDPDPEAQAAYRKYFRRTSFHIETCSGITDAAERFRSRRYDCILLDVHLPEMKGYEAVGLIKRKDPDARIIVTAGDNSKTLEARVRQEDIFYYYIKSFNSDELLQAVQSAVKRRDEA